MSKNKQPSAEKSGLTGFRLLWDSRAEMNLDEWIISVSEGYFSHGLGLESSASLVDCQPSELQAAILLATLEEDTLRLIAAYNPPITTWFFLAECPPEHVEAVLKAVVEESSDIATAEVASRKIKELLGPNSLESLSALDSSAYSHLYEKARQYDVLSERSRGALKSFGGRMKSGKTLTIKQLAYAQDLLTQMADLGVIRRNSPDNDEEIMLVVLKALGRA